MRELITTESMKYKRSSLVVLVLFGPIVLALLEYVLVRFYSDGQVVQTETIYLANMQALRYAMNFFIVYIIVFVIHIEYKHYMWETTFTYPVTKLSLYISKFLVIVTFVVLFCLINAFTTILLMPILGFPLKAVTLYDVAAYSFFPFLLSIPFCTLAFIISINVANQAWVFSLALGSLLYSDLLNGEYFWWMPFVFQNLYSPLNYVKSPDFFLSMLENNAGHIISGIPISLFILSIGYGLFIKIYNKFCLSRRMRHAKFTR